ncbi:Retrovirus-related Pol poly from transposon [Brachionus plicatilis]|uniref:Retrovirus-related Pol poly from transposon n=1 Tax=Brachionus plicatilis TaxID=10195 RepID=A0A3M7RI32_BRAPC|nr:Retrovirus-related Pol poly from transposon [Brachionus plicatilis]
MGCIIGIEVKLGFDSDARPVKKKLRPVAIHLQDSVKRELEKQVDEGKLEKVNSLMGSTLWISNLVVGPKAYHQSKLAKESRHLTTITPHCGLKGYKRLHMSISSASEEFTEAIRKTYAKYDEALINVLKRLKNRKVTLNVAKREQTFFGLKISTEDIKPTDECQDLREATPTSHKRESSNSSSTIAPKDRQQEYNVGHMTYQFGFQIVYKPGSTNVAGYFSRHPILSKQSNQDKQNENYIYMREDGVMLKGNRIIIPDSLRTIEQYGWRSKGIDTKTLLRSKYCIICQALVNKTEFAPLGPSEMPDGPWQEISADFYGPMADGIYFFVNHGIYNRWRMRARELQIEIGVKVLPKIEQKKKSDSEWDPEPYTVTAMKGTMVTASRNGHILIHNSSFFKPYYWADDTEIPSTTSPHEIPSFKFIQENIAPTQPIDSRTSSPADQAIPGTTISNQTGRKGSEDRPKQRR